MTVGVQDGADVPGYPFAMGLPLFRMMHSRGPDSTCERRQERAGAPGYAEGSAQPVGRDMAAP